MPSFKNLHASYKKLYPFCLAAPSYIYPADWCTNVQLLGPYVDEIELLLLESHAESCLPSPDEIQRLSSLGSRHCVTYNIHLPSDISLSDPMKSKRREAVEKLSRVISLTAPLMPSTWTLHLPFDRPVATPEAIAEWQVRNREGLLELLRISGISSRDLSIETLFYPFAWIGDVVRALNLSICLDAGHLMIKGVNVTALFAEYADIITILHLHGVCRHNESEHGVYRHGPLDPVDCPLIDHESLNRLSAKRVEDMMALLQQFKGVVSLEVFSFNRLDTSLQWLSERWRTI